MLSILNICSSSFCLQTFTSNSSSSIRFLASAIVPPQPTCCWSVLKRPCWVDHSQHSHVETPSCNGSTKKRSFRSFLCFVFTVVARMGRRSVGYSSDCSWRFVVPLKCSLQTRVLALIGKFFCPIRWIHVFKMDLFVCGSLKNERCLSLYILDPH